jgi:hypothetical protein
MRLRRRDAREAKHLVEVHDGHWALARHTAYVTVGGKRETPPRSYSGKAMVG